MRISAYISRVLLAAGVLATAWWLWTVDPWFDLAWGGGLAAVGALAWISTSPTYWGDHARHGPRARRRGRRGPNGPDPTSDPRRP
jgi:hypothetical protein